MLDDDAVALPSRHLAGVAERGIAALDRGQVGVPGQQWRREEPRGRVLAPNTGRERDICDRGTAAKQHRVHERVNLSGRPGVTAPMSRPALNVGKF